MALSSKKISIQKYEIKKTLIYKKKLIEHILTTVSVNAAYFFHYFLCTKIMHMYLYIIIIINIYTIGVKEMNTEL